MRVKIPAHQSKFYPFQGGLDLTSPPIQINPGALRACLNVEIGVRGGYLPLGGYERFSGKAKPSDAVYAVLPCVITGALAVGDVLTDNTAAAYGTVIAITATEIILTMVTGTFAIGNVKVGATVVGTCSASQSDPVAETQAIDATYRNLAADVYRALIAEVPGAGDILGVWQYNGKVYAFRNNVGLTAAVLHVSSASGWTAVTMMRELVFTSGGVYEPLEGDVITGTISGATATIRRVCLRSGSFAAGTAAGSFIVSGQVGNFVAENLDIPAHLNSATIATNSTEISFAPSGRFEFVNWNFGGASGTNRMYGCDGKSKAFEFDGTVLAPITTGMTADTPLHIRAHKNQLFLSFGSSVQHSGIGFPYSFTPVFGAAEIACGDTVTNFLSVPGSQSGAALVIYTKNRTLILYGNDSSDWVLVPFSEEAGARAYTAQFIGRGVVLDDQGIMALDTTQDFGNFSASALSQQIAPLIDSLEDDYTPTASCISRKKNQYRLFWTSGQAVYMTMQQGKVLGFTSVTLPDAVSCMCSQEGATGGEEIYFGSPDGFVYQMDVGTSFDGDPISWSASLAFNHFGSPRAIKSFHKAVLEVTGKAYCEFSFTSSLAYDSVEFDQSDPETTGIELSSATWDNFTWDQFYWDSRALSPTEVDVTGSAENLSLIFSGNSDEFKQFTLHSAVVHYTPRRVMR
jgi:hypothetical protein